MESNEPTVIEYVHYVRIVEFQAWNNVKGGDHRAAGQGFCAVHFEDSLVLFIVRMVTNSRGGSPN